MADQKKRGRAQITKQNFLESLKDLGSSTIDRTGDLLQSTSEDFFKELIGISTPVKRSGEIGMGESLSISEVISGKDEEVKKLKAQIGRERQIFQEEKMTSEQKTDKLRLELKTIMTEVEKTAVSTTELAKEIKIATFQAPASPGIYHLVFFENLLEFIRSFREKIEEAATWLASTNKRAQKKNYWNTYKKKGSSFLLSPDHYLQRSAG